MATLFSKTEIPPRVPNLERQAIWFTIGLYLLISAGLLTMHYAHAQEPVGSSSVSPAHSSYGSGR
ncbi:hypothetical protein [Nocardia sp. NPDC052566]|uniref:hypothetical protein n=1 Tax=Nocardia sp. NPDC052566 TaxID=3364330 RepID=UPI0037C7512F